MWSGCGPHGLSTILGFQKLSITLCQQMVFWFEPYSHHPRNSSLASYFHLKVLVFEIPHSLGISNNHQSGGYGHFLELHIIVSASDSLDGIWILPSQSLPALRILLRYLLFPHVTQEGNRRISAYSITILILLNFNYFIYYNLKIMYGIRSLRPMVTLLQVRSLHIIVRLLHTIVRLLHTIVSLFQAFR